MLVSRKYYGIREPNRDAKRIYIFCEGKDTEYKYFLFFANLDSRISIEPYKLASTESNDPWALYQIAKKSILKCDSNPKPKYDFIEGDEVWLVFDSDIKGGYSRKNQIKNTRKACKLLHWNIAESNPCFEVWLYHHFFEEKPTLANIEVCANWKQFLSSNIGGFDSRKYPAFIQIAIQNAENQYSEDNEIPNVACTQVFRLAKVFYPFIEEHLNP